MSCEISNSPIDYPGESLLDTERRFELKSNYLSEAPTQCLRMAQRKGANFTIMVVGESCLGKSTLIRSLFGSEFTVSKRQQTSENLRKESLNSTSEENSRADLHRTAEIEVYQAVVEENKFVTKLTIIETPGFGDYTNNTNTWVPIAQYIDAQHQMYMLQQEQPDRTLLTDSRVNLCLYFLAPTNRLMELDLVSMRELSTRVNLVPVIAKADSMTPTDLQEFKRFVRETLKERNIEIWQPQNEQYAQKWPLAVVSSDEVVQSSLNNRVRGRQYRWGTIDIENPEHSDFVALRDCLFHDNMLNLIETTNDVHYSRQRQRMRILRLQHALGVNKQDPSAGLSAFQSPTKLAPCDRPSLSFMSSALRNSDASRPDSTSETAMGMTGIETLIAISKFGLPFLENERRESDILLHQRALALKAQFDVVVKFQESRFDAQALELEQTRDELSRQITEKGNEISALVSEIQELESAAKKRK